MSSSLPQRHQPIFDPEDVVNLTQEGTIIPVDEGCVKLHKRRLHKWAEDEYKDLPLPSPDTPASLEHYVDVPTHLISREPLVYIGFTSTMASTLWVQWNALGSSQETNGGDVTFDSFFLATIKETPSTYSEDDGEWRREMDTMGIGNEKQDAIMEPVFKDIRLTETCKYWVSDTLDAGYNGGLKEFRDMSRDRAEKARKGRDESSGQGTRPKAGNRPSTAAR